MVFPYSRSGAHTVASFTIIQASMQGRGPTALSSHEMDERVPEMYLYERVALCFHRPTPWNPQMTS
jgi:hypothetical protein